MAVNKRTPTKQKLLNILKKDQKLTIKEIMVYFSISEIAVRRHIHELIQQGFLKKQSMKQKIGRPYYTYELAEKGHATFPNENETLPLEILQDLEATQGKQAVKSVLAQRMKRERAQFLEEVESENFDQRISTIVRIQEDKGFMIEYDQTTDGDYEIRNYNCPIINIASEYQQVCSNEKQVLGEVFPNSKVISRSCIASGGKFCNWIITKPLEEVRVEAGEIEQEC